MPRSANRHIQAFGDIAAKCHGFHSWGPEPGRTLAFEFNDGKLMFSAVEQLTQFTPHSVRELLTDGTYTAACEVAQVIALTDWSLYPYMTQVWRLLQSEVFSVLAHRPAFFIDLVDPSTRSVADIRDMAAILHKFEPVGPLTLGLNGNEANVLCRAHDVSSTPADATPEQTLQQAFALRDLFGVSRVVIHRVPFAVSTGRGVWIHATGSVQRWHEEEHRCRRPFQRGLLSRARAGPRRQRITGARLCRFRVLRAQRPQSANRQELVDFLERWTAGFVGRSG